MARWGVFLLLTLLPQDPGESLGSRIEALRTRHKLDKAKLSLQLVDARTGEVLYASGAERRLVPASNVKLVSSAQALLHLGKDYRFRTELYVDGRIRGDALEGDLVVRTDGDPNISGRFFDSATAVFEGWKERLGGIRKITGSLVLVDEHFERTEIHPDWKEDGNDLSRWYCAPVRGFAFNDNCVDFEVGPGEVGGTCAVRMSPPTDYVTVEDKTRTVGGKPGRPVAFWRKPESRHILLRGERGPKSWPISFSCTVPNPTRYFGRVLLETLGIKAPIREANKMPESLEGRDPLEVHEFDLKRTLQVCNRRSQNLYAEMLFKKAGGGSWESAEKAAAEFMASIGREGVTVRDGSGLSRKNRLSAADLTALLRSMIHRKGFETYYFSLAAPGDKEGTLRRRLKELKGRLRAKTGHLRGVSSLSGYLKTEGGDELVFSILINGGGRKDAFQDAVVRLWAALD